MARKAIYKITTRNIVKFYKRGRCIQWLASNSDFTVDQIKDMVRDYEQRKANAD